MMYKNGRTALGTMAVLSIGGEVRLGKAHCYRLYITMDRMFIEWTEIKKSLLHSQAHS
jgi:hypothetical protein